MESTKFAEVPATGWGWTTWPMANRSA